MKKILLSLLTLGFGAFTLNAQTLDQSNTAPVGSGWVVNSGAYTSNGQSFTAGMTDFLHSISINIDATNSSYPILAGDFTLTIRSGHGYGGTVLNIDTFTVTGTEPSGWLNIPVKPNTVAITAGNSYTYIIDEISGTGQLNIVASNNAYAGGDLYYQVFTNPATIDGTRDFIFQTYMQASLTCNIADQTVTASQTTLCDSGAVTISTGSSETGYNYYLRDDADSSIVDGPIAGTGSGLTFNTGTINTTTTYNVYAKEPKISAVDLPANTDLIQFTNAFFAYTNEITIEAWVDFKGTLLRAGQSSAAVDNMATNVWLWDAGSFFVNNNGTWIGLLFPTTIPTGWTHVATVANASGMFIYYNGVLVASNSTGITAGIRNNSNSVIDLGHDPRFSASVRNNNHSFDNFAVWNVARTATEIATNLNNCLLGTEPGLVQYTKMNEGSGTTLSSLVGANGTITNGLANPWVLGSDVCDDACDLEMTQTVTITVNNSPTSSITSQTNVSCNGGTNGAATVSTTGGTAPYTYLWSTAATTATATGLAAGNYNVTITDANGCTTNVSNITITEPTALASSVTSQTNVACNGGTNGSATVSATGGTAPYTYLWSNAATTATATGLAAGNYNVTITDANGCTTNVSNITITEPNALTGSIISTNVSCNGGTNGSATVSPSGGTAPYTFLWSTAATTATATGLAAGNYNVTVTDANSCTTNVSNITITEPAIITGTDVQTACNSYTWIDNNTYTASNNTATHTLTGGAANGCDSIVTLDLTITTVDNSTTLNANTISANQNSASYKWLDCDNGNAVISGATAQNFTPTVTGNYAVEVTLGSCVDTSACTNVIITSIDESIMENVNIFPNPTKDDINIELPLNEFTSVEVKIYSVTGKLVYNASQNNISKLSISTANWDKGLYFIQLISNNQTITEKIIKQ